MYFVVGTQIVRKKVWLFFFFFFFSERHTCTTKNKTGAWYWKELELSKIDLKKHITKLELDWSSEEKSEVNEAEEADRHVQKIAALLTEKQLNRQFDSERPHWDVIYASLKGRENRVFGYLRCHHAIGDGVILMKSIFGIYEKLWPGEDNKLHGFAKKIIESGRRADIGTDLEKEATKKQNRASVLTTVDLRENSRVVKDLSFADIRKEFPGIVKDFYSLLYKEPIVPLKTVFHKADLKREYELSVSKSINMGNVKILCHHFSCTVNDLMIYKWLNSLSKYLHKNADKSELAKWKQLYGDDIVVRFITVFNLRKPGSKAEDAEENDLGMLPIKFPLGDMSFESRLKIVKKILNESKKGSSVKLSIWLTRIFYAWGGASYVAKVLEKASSKCVALLSNLKGPVLPLAIGTDGLMWRFCCATNPTFSPLTCGIASFAGNMNVSLATDINTMTSKQSQEIVNDILIEFDRVFKSLPDENYRWF
ncbi:hypothetical protein RFI_33073 [Reticulomyxa filosa]|uniref:O-acyltransferase WSD1 C-terminal domain-containing protein n=1 Tax=Reticulomyxa filosa TaxID=46433 RepID=X6LUC9_RETFI|nr:hypothetical protein RFI_33073 [Reticulomyxa filosa]|eukprot:ETO04325.1 hypothetical protein RFI_33073 [Reticulomyxa filosa]